MEIVKNILIVIDFIICIALIVLVLKQSKEDNGASGAVMGGSSNNFYEKNKGRTTEGKIKRATVLLTAVFFILSIAIGIVYMV